MADKFTTDFEVTFFETDIKERLEFGYLLAFLQDTAIRHSAAIGYGIEKLLERKRGWIILNWHICIDKMPCIGDKLSIATWCGKCGRHQAERSFTAQNDKGEMLAYAVTNWAFIDLEKRKPAVIPPEMEEVFKSDIPNVIEKEKYRIRKPEEADFYYGRSIAVSRSDLDTNEHVNNTRYLVWAMDAVSDEIYDNYDLFDVKVTYRKESKKGDVLRLKTAVYNEGENAETIIYFISEDDPKTIYVQISFLWRKK